MHKREKIADQIRQNFEVRTSIRDEALKQARQLTRACSLAIRAVHRSEFDTMEGCLAEAQTLANKLRTDLKAYPDLYYAGYTQDSLKEFVEANVTCALIQNQALHTPEELGVEYATYLNGLAEVVGELRRRILDILQEDTKWNKKMTGPVRKRTNKRTGIEPNRSERYPHNGLAQSPAE